MARVPSQWALVLDQADPETASLILSLAFQDLALAETEVDAQTTEALQNDQAIARSLHQNELKEYQKARNIELVPFNELAAQVQPHSPAKTLLFKCRACLDQFNADHCYEVPCQHCYCDGCLTKLFETAMIDSTLYPPRCCKQNIPIEDVRLFLDKDLVAQFEAKKEELGDARPTFCYKTTCQTYIGAAQKKENVGVCPACAEQTCLLCKKVAHSGDCPEDDAMKQTLDLAKQEGWQKCPSCERLVELNLGCNHMTCRCSAQFCYACGTPWKSCRCPQFEERRLLGRAQQVADRDGANVDEVMARLRRNHECTSHRWEWRHGGGNCETCGDYLHTFLFHCERCMVQICRRCRDNRS